MGDDGWRIFAEMCQTVCENDNVFLDVIITNGMIEFMLMPIEEDCDE